MTENKNEIKAPDYFVELWSRSNLLIEEFLQPLNMTINDLQALTPEGLKSFMKKLEFNQRNDLNLRLQYSHNIKNYIWSKLRFENPELNNVLSLKYDPDRHVIIKRMPFFTKLLNELMGGQSV